MVRGQPLRGFRGGTKHLAVYPSCPEAVDAVRHQLPGASLSKGMVRFTVEGPIPEQAIRDLVRARLDEIAGS